METIVKELFVDTIIKLPHDTTEGPNEAAAKDLVIKALNLIAERDEEKDESDLASFVMIIAVNMKHERWNSEQLVLQAQTLCKEKLCKGLDMNTATLDLFRKNSRLCKIVNKMITATLKRETWNRHAVTCQLYYWYCHSLKFPLASEHLDVLLPPCLNFMDSYDDGIKLFGLECLYHILSECGQAELLWHNRAQVIYDALHKLTYTKEERLITLIHPTMIKILDVFEKDLSRPEVPRYADTEYHELLSAMYLEDKLVLRRVYANSMKMYVKHLKQKVIKHLKLTMKITLSYLEDSCGSAELTRVIMLEILDTLLETAKPRIHNYYDDIIKHLFRLVVDTCVLTMETETKPLIVTSVIKQLSHIHSDDIDITSLIEALIKQMPQDAKTGKSTVETMRTILNAIK